MDKESVGINEPDYCQKTLETIIKATKKGYFAWLRAKSIRPENDGECCYALLAPGVDECETVLYMDNPRIEFTKDGELLQVAYEKDYPKLFAEVVAVAKKSASKLFNRMGIRLIDECTTLTMRRELNWEYTDGLYKMIVADNFDAQGLDGLEMTVDPKAFIAKVEDAKSENGRTEIYTDRKAVKRLVKAIKHPDASARKIVFKKIVLPFLIGAACLLLSLIVTANAPASDKAYKVVVNDPTQAERIVSYNDFLGIRRYSLLYGYKKEIKLEKQGDSTYSLGTLTVKLDDTLDESRIDGDTLYVPSESYSSERTTASALMMARAYLLYFIFAGFWLYPKYKKLDL